MATDTDTQAEHDGEVYVYKRVCKRCGRIIAYGAVRAPLILGQDVSLPAKVLEWIHDTKHDYHGKGHV